MRDEERLWPRKTPQDQTPRDWTPQGWASQGWSSPESPSWMSQDGQFTGQEAGERGPEWLFPRENADQPSGALSHDDASRDDGDDRGPEPAAPAQEAPPTLRPSGAPQTPFSFGALREQF